MKTIISRWNRLSLVKQIVAGLLAGLLLAWLFPQAAWIGIFGSFFVSALKAVAPALVFALVLSAISGSLPIRETNLKSILVLYGASTLLAGTTAVVASFLFPVGLSLVPVSEELRPPEGIADVLLTLLFQIVDNPVNALIKANYLGILAWALVLGIALKQAQDATRQVIGNLSDAVLKLVTWVIRLAPIGILGLIFTSITDNGLAALLEYGKLLMLLIGCMLFVALVVNPLLVYANLRRNPYPLVFRCLRESGITAFFTRSSAANIPVNMALCKRLDLDRSTYAVSIPLGATINMSGAAVTVSVLTLAAVHTLGIAADLGTALLLCVVSAIAAAGASGVAGGSLLLIPLACSLFGIPNEIAVQVIGVGFIVGVLQDSFETALNSSSDVLFTATAAYAKKS